MRVVGSTFVQPEGDYRIPYRRYSRTSSSGGTPSGGDWLSVFDLAGVEEFLDNFDEDSPFYEEMEEAILGGASLNLPLFMPIPSRGADVPLTEHNIGLTRVRLGWEFPGGADNGFIKQVHGYKVRVVPDPKVSPGLPGQVFEFEIPKVVTETNMPDIDLEDWNLPGRGHRVHGIDEIVFGALHWYPTGDSAWGSDSLVQFWEGRYHPEAPDSVPPADYYPEARPEFFFNHGAEAKDGYEHFNLMMKNLPLTRGFKHEVSISPYHIRPDGGRVYGPFSDPLPLDGDHEACAVAGDEGVPQSTRLRIAELYDCGGHVALPIEAPEQGFRPGILSLTGSEICTDIFTTTEGIYTWDNGTVKQVWRLMWIIAGAVLFSLLVWQGLRMTYDVWLDPQPSVGFREIVPRFLLAVLLAAGSLVLCRIVLVIASDLTCFIAQMTQMSMFGVFTQTIGAFFSGYINWGLDLLTDASITRIIKGAILLFASGILLALLFMFVLILFVKVFLTMLMRIPFLAVLVALSPLAFAFYASDSTSHWTKKWITIFLGTTFQQAVVLVVLFMGIRFVNAALSGAMDSAYGTLIVGLLSSLLILALADKVPSIVNPAWSGAVRFLRQHAEDGGFRRCGWGECRCRSRCGRYCRAPGRSDDGSAGWRQSHRRWRRSCWRWRSHRWGRRSCWRWRQSRWRRSRRWRRWWSHWRGWRWSGVHAPGQLVLGRPGSAAEEFHGPCPRWRPMGPAVQHPDGGPIQRQRLLPAFQPG